MSPPKFGYSPLYIFGLILMIAAGVFGIRFLNGKQLTSSRGAKFIPDEASMTALVSTDINSWSNFSQLLPPEEQISFEDIWKDKIEIGENNISYFKDIQPWLGNMLIGVIAKTESPSFLNPKTPKVLVFDPEEYDFLFVVGIKNKFKAWNFFKKIKQQITTENNKYKGVEINQFSEKNDEPLYYYAVMGDIILLSPTEKTVKLGIDTVKGEPSFLDKEGTKEIFKQKTGIQNPLAQLYVVGYSNIKQIKSAVIGMKAEEKAIRIKAHAQLAPGIIQENFKPITGKIVKKFPNNTVSLIKMNGKNFPLIFSELQRLAMANPDIQFFLAEKTSLLQQYNMDLNRDILDLLDGEFALGFIPTNSRINYMGIGMTMMLETSKSNNVQNTLNKFQEIAQFNAPIRIQNTKIQGKNLTEWQTPQKETVFSYTWLENNYLAGNVMIPFNEIINSQPLTTNETFVKIQKYLPEKNIAYWYFDKDFLLLGNIEQDYMFSSFEGIGLSLNELNETSVQIDLVFLSGEETTDENSSKQLRNQQFEQEAKNGIAALNRVQQSYHFERQEFADNLNNANLGSGNNNLGIKLKSDNYSFSSRVSEQVAFHTAISKQDDLRSYIGAITYNAGIYDFIICQANSPGKRKLPKPVVLNNAKLLCANGSTEFK